MSTYLYQVLEHPTSHFPFKPSREQRDNLTKLADFLESIPAEPQASHPVGFSMRTFVAYTDGEREWFPERADYTRCGTVACAAGHGPAAGIPALPDESWDSYIRRAFGAGLISKANPSSLFLFSAGWQDVDDTPQGAALRIRYALRHGIPNNAASQMNGKSPLCYRESRP